MRPYFPQIQAYFGVQHGTEIAKTENKIEKEVKGMELFKRFVHEEDGQGLTEYALIIALIAVAVIAVMVIFRNQIRNVFTKATEEMQNTE